jgi:RND family efflux transporter MFP subunit
LSVVCATTQVETIDHVTELRGMLQAPPERQAMAAPSVSGPLESVRVQEGDAVHTGDVLAQVDAGPLRTAVEQASAEVQAAQAATRRAQAAATRAQKLFDDGILARKDLEQASADNDAAKAALAGAESRRRQAEQARGRATLRSPIDGVVVRILRRPGEVVDGTSATPVAEIADPSILELRADVPAAALVQLSRDQNATVAVDALPGQLFGARVIALSPAIDATTALGWARVRLDQNEATSKLHLGLPATARIEGQGHAALMVPASALRRAPGGADEVVVCARGEHGSLRAEAREVELGQREPDRVEVKSGLREGERIVIDRVVGLADGAPIVDGGSRK